ncbi:MAG TPA: hypothetical protein DCL74_02315 [Succinivibrionaceae bacterium]|nr:hypothetical protein [Succinivibrionaceae bacterium]
MLTEIVGLQQDEKEKLIFFFICCKHLASSILRYNAIMAKFKKTIQLCAVDMREKSRKIFYIDRSNS